MLLRIDPLTHTVNRLLKRIGDNEINENMK